METQTYRFSGPQPGYKDIKTRTKGVMRAYRLTKKKEALARNAQTPLERTAHFRRQSPEVQAQILQEQAA